MSTAEGSDPSKEEDDFDLFASDYEEEEIDEIKKERLQKYAEKKAKSEASYCFVCPDFYVDFCL